MMKQREWLTTHKLKELKKTSSWAMVDPATPQAPTNQLNHNARAVKESEAWSSVMQLKIKHSY